MRALIFLESDAFRIIVTLEDVLARMETADAVIHADDFCCRKVYDRIGFWTSGNQTTLTCLSELFEIKLEEQTWAAAVGMHGAGGYRAQCGLVEGGLIFLGIYWYAIGKTEAVAACYAYAEAYEQHFGSLLCWELRPQGFSANAPPHMCEKLTCESILFTYQYVLEHLELEN